jgi:hypothetical protein
VSARAAALCALVIAAACGGEAPDEAAPEAAPAQTPALAPPPRSSITMTPSTGAPGAEVTLVMSGLMMNQQTEVGFGTLTGHEIIDTMSASASGDVSAVVRVPASAPPGTYYFFIAERNGPPLAVSDSFVVTAGP